VFNSEITPNKHQQKLKFSPTMNNNYQAWQGDLNTVSFDAENIKNKLMNLNFPCYILNKEGQIGISNKGSLSYSANGKSNKLEMLLTVPAIEFHQLGDPNFLEFYGTKYAYMTGAMAQGIASEEMVIALGKANILSSFGAGGLLPARVESAIHKIQQALHNKSYAFNLLHSPSEPAIERRLINLYLQHQVRIIEASAFLDLSDNIVYYRAAGLSLNSANQIEINNKIIAKVSRREIATKFLQPAPTKILTQLVEQGLISELQANLAAKIPMADDITIEADSGGHTDNRPLVCLLPYILELRDEIQRKYNYEKPVRIGVAGGISTPQSALASFMMGAAYIVTGSINQSCIEAGTSEYTKKLLSEAEMTDVMMAPAADMFEMGVKLQVLKRGTLFPLRAQKIFRWYLGLSSRWSNTGEKGREIDYQIWCGPAMGSFNNWVRGSYLADINNRRVVDIADQIMTGAAYLYRVQNLKIQGLQMPEEFSQYHPVSNLNKQPSL